MTVFSFSILAKIAATATLALIACAVLGAAAGGDARARPLDGRASPEICLYMIF